MTTEKRLHKRAYKESTANRIPLYFWGKVVGHIVEPSGEMWFIYGQWQPVRSPTYDEFVSCIKTNEQAEVIIGDGQPPQKGFVNELPDDTIEVKCSPS